ncbi:hypothetical protein NKI51_30175 [Mesorhizobium australicum]|uniref:hypothetical protein n=1 Tax=Mesorhizobium australicum TaxID=536018 RepID=UPI003339B64F
MGRDQGYQRSKEQQGKANTRRARNSFCQCFATAEAPTQQKPHRSGAQKIPRARGSMFIGTIYLNSIGRHEGTQRKSRIRMTAFSRLTFPVSKRALVGPGATKSRNASRKNNVFNCLVPGIANLSTGKRGLR